MIWLMLLPYMSVVDVITTEADVIACYIFILLLLADVIANMWQMLWPLWCNVVADVNAKWQME